MVTERRETETATATSFRETCLGEDEDEPGKRREEMFAGNVARELWEGGGGGEA